MLDLVQLTPFAKRKPHQISGGQRQRVALARALARQPKLLLLDEPLAALDKKLREHTQFELMSIQERTGVTFIVVTHDQEEAMTLADRIAVMDKGEVRQIGSPTEVYEFPPAALSPGFIGSVNSFRATVLGPRRRRSLRLEVPAFRGEVLARDVPGRPRARRSRWRSGPKRSPSRKTRPEAGNVIRRPGEGSGLFRQGQPLPHHPALGRAGAGPCGERPPRGDEAAGGRLGRRGLAVLRSRPPPSCW
jgi:putrescine transport system ATP-binding protein